MLHRPLVYEFGSTVSNRRDPGSAQLRTASATSGHPWAMERGVLQMVAAEGSHMNVPSGQLTPVDTTEKPDGTRRDESMAM